MSALPVTVVASNGQTVTIGTVDSVTGAYTPIKQNLMAGIGPGGVPVSIAVSASGVVSTSGGGGAVTGNGGTDQSSAPPAAMTTLKTGTISVPGQIYVQNQSAATVQLILTAQTGGTTTILIDPNGAGANRQGGDWSGTQNMPWFVGTFTINGAAGAQVACNRN